MRLDRLPSFVDTFFPTTITPDAIVKPTLVIRVSTPILFLIAVLRQYPTLDIHFWDSPVRWGAADLNALVEIVRTNPAWGDSDQLSAFAGVEIHSRIGFREYVPYRWPYILKLRVMLKAEATAEWWDNKAEKRRREQELRERLGFASGKFRGLVVHVMRDWGSGPTCPSILGSL